MKLRIIGLLVLIVTVSVACGGAPKEVSDTAASRAGSQGAQPRTAWGDPDLGGIWSPGYYLTPSNDPISMTVANS